MFWSVNDCFGNSGSGEMIVGVQNLFGLVPNPSLGLDGLIPDQQSNRWVHNTITLEVIV